MVVHARFRAPAAALPLRSVVDGDLAVEVTIQRVVPFGPGPHYCWVCGPDRDEAVDAMVADEIVGAAEVVDELAEQTLLRLELDMDASPLFATVEDVDATLTRVSGENGRWLVEATFGTQAALANFYDACLAADVPIELRQVSDMDRRTADRGNYGLSGPQLEAVTVAHEAGYFEVPRRTTIADVAAELGLSDQAVSERIRRGLGSLVESTFRSDAESGDGE